VGHWLHFSRTEQLDLEIDELLEYYKEACEIEKAYFAPKEK
jgi:hypothetical protein